jgi:hypothetical protein
MTDLQELQERLDDYQENPSRRLRLSMSGSMLLLQETWTHIDQGSLEAIDLALGSPTCGYGCSNSNAWERGGDNDTEERDK